MLRKHETVPVPQNRSYLKNIRVKLKAKDMYFKE